MCFLCVDVENLLNTGCSLILSMKWSNRFFFKTDRYEGTLYKRSPYFVGSKLWDALEREVIELPDLLSFMARIKKMNRVYYVDLL